MVNDMNALQTSDLKQLEKQVYHSLWEDGLVDIFVGIALVGLGSFWLSTNAGYGAIFIPILIPFWSVARERITLPRLGQVTLSAERQVKEHRKLGGMIFLGVVVMAIGVAWFMVIRGGGPRPDWLAHSVAGLPAMLLAFGAMVTAFAIGQLRFFIYSAALAASGVVVVLLSLRPGWGFLPAGIVALLTGAVHFYRFLRKYPR